LAGAARRSAVAWAIAGAVCATGLATAAPLDLERSLAERQQRWRAARSAQLRLPLPGTPDTGQLMTRLHTAGVALGAPMLLRVFKAESELEVWLKSGDTFTLFATYPVCYWSGALGPKLREGDRQSPEGFYTVTEQSLHHGERWRRSLNVGYPNIFDRVNGRGGSAILIHGGCDSSGCFAMTDPVNAELYDLVAAALRTTKRVPLQAFPFRMTDANMAANAASPWLAFWRDLKAGYDSFERTRLPPHVSVCGKRYRVRDASPFEREAEDVTLCEQDRATLAASLTQAGRAPRPSANAVRPAPACNLGRASCRKWVALKERQHLSRTIAGRSTSGKRSAVR
jgi:murein L,D-transpeptidase YafK